MTRKLYVKSYGCQMNAYDSQRMADTLAPEGFVETATPDGADLIILNTCHIREKAAEKVYSELGRMRELKEQAARRRPPRHARGRRLRRAGRRQGDRPPQRRGRSGVRPAELSPAAGPAGARRATARWSTPNFPPRTSSIISRAPSRAAMRKRGVSAFVTVQEGCDKFCTFCVVPYTRGAEVSRPVAKIVAEAERLADAGVREITLIGQNVNAYHGEGADGGTASLARLALSARRRAGHRAAALHHQPSARHGRPPDRRAPRPAGADAAPAPAGAVGLRPHARGDEPPPHPRRISRRDRAAAPRAARHRVLVRLHRRLSRRDRGRFPAHASSWSSEVGYASAYSFKYSPRPGTPAAEMDQLPEAVKDERLQRLQHEIDRQLDAFNARSLGATMDVLFEKPGQAPWPDRRQIPISAAVHVMAPSGRSLIGEIHPVTIADDRQLHAVRNAGGAHARQHARRAGA